MLSAACGKLVVTRLRETWPQELNSLLIAYDSRDKEKEKSDSDWSLERIIDDHLKEYPSAGELWSKIPAEMISIIKKCLEVNPDKRPSVNDLLATPEYSELITSRIDSISPPKECNKLSQDSWEIERQQYLDRIKELEEKAAMREERMLFLETVLAEERAGHFRTADLLEEEKAKLEEALEKLAEFEGEDDTEESQKPPVPEVIGLHHPGPSP